MEDRGMDLNKIYYDVDGNAHNILEMMKEEPEWAANRIQVGAEAIAENAELRAQLAK